MHFQTSRAKKSTQSSQPAIYACFFAALLVLNPVLASAESLLRLPFPAEFGHLAASTYDAQGVRIGGGSVRIERLTEGGVKMIVSSDMGVAGRNLLTADLAPVDGGTALQLLREENRSVDIHGNLLETITVDHAHGELRCSGEGGTKQIPLPEEDRLAMIPGNLFLQPLLRGQEQQIRFQIASCNGVAGFHFINVAGELARLKPEDSVDITRVDIHVDLGRILNKVIVPLLPKVAFWFDSQNHHWLGHRIPTYANGPTVILVREPTTAKTLLYGASAHVPSPIAALD